MREDWPERPEMEDMRRLVELYARGHLPPDVLTLETRRTAFVFNVAKPLRRWFARLRSRETASDAAQSSAAVEITFHRLAR